MGDALIGHTGFGGSNLGAQHRFDAVYNSTTIGRAPGARHRLVVCAGAPRFMTIANRAPQRDALSIRCLTAALGEIHAELFVLISTVVFNR